MVSEKKILHFFRYLIFTLKDDQKWSPLPGARQFKGDSLLVTLDLYPSKKQSKQTR